MYLAPDKDQQDTSIPSPTDGSSSEPVQKLATAQDESDNSQESTKDSSKANVDHNGLIQGLDDTTADSQQKYGPPLPDPTNLDVQLNSSSDASGSPDSHTDQHSPRPDSYISLPEPSQSNSTIPPAISTATPQTPGAALNAFLTRNMPSQLHGQTMLDSTPSHQEASFTPPPPTADGSQSLSIPPSNNSPSHSPPSPPPVNGKNIENEQIADGSLMLVDEEKRPRVRKLDALEKSPEQSNGPSTRLRPRNKRPPEPKAKEPPKRSRTGVARTIRSAVEISSAGSSSPSWAHPVDMNSTKNPQDVEMQESTSVEAGSSKRTEMESNINSPSVYTESIPEVTNGSTNDNPNLDPALTSQPLSNQTISPPTPTLNDANGSVKPPTSNTDDKKSTGLPQSPLANNPYLSLSTAYTKSNAGSPTYNPYALYYGPGAPLPSHTPPYPYPYYYLPSPIPGPSVYPTNHNFVPQNNTQQQKTQQSDGQKPKPKRLKAHTVTTGNHNIPVVPRDKNGKPMLPLNVGIMTVIQLGEVCMREHFHTERYIFPVGYEVTRRYLSTLDPNMEVVYHCTILDGGDGPKFQIVPSDAPQRTVIAGTATGAWSNIVKQANAIRNRQHSNSVSGPDFFGLGQNTIKHLIQQLPNANRLRDYVWQNFVEGGPLGGRHAAVTPALPEDYDSTLPIGALYPNERDRLKRDISVSPRGLNHYPPHIVAHVEAQRQAVDISNGHQHVAQVPPVPQPHHLPTSASSASQISNGQVIPSPPPNEQLQIVPQQEHVHNQVGSAAVPTTIASLMNAYPVPANTSASS